MLKRLQKSVHYPNAWIVNQGYLWVKKHLHDPVRHLRKIIADPTVKQLGMFYDAYTILSDVNFILGSYLTAYHWCSLGYAIDASTTEMLDDMITLSQYTGITENLDRCVELYHALDPDYKVNIVIDTISPEQEKILRMWHELNMFRPQKVFETTTSEDDADLSFIKTLAFGAVREIDIFKLRLQKHIESGGELKIEHLYYFPSPVLDSPEFWKSILEYKTQIATTTCDFDIIVSNKTAERDPRFVRGYEDMPPLLHLARTEHDLNDVKKMVCDYPTWKDPEFCFRFFKKHARMPKWRELYVFLNFHSKNFLTGERPKQFQ